jgi:hypothetical protein
LKLGSKLYLFLGLESEQEPILLIENTIEKKLEMRANWRVN